MIGRDPTIVSFAKRIAAYLVRFVDYNFRSTICGSAVQQRGWTTTRPITICHFFLVLTTMGVIET